MNVDVEEFVEKLVDFINEEGTWNDFIVYMESEGYEQSEFPPPYNDEEEG